MYKQAIPIKYFVVFVIVILGVFATYLSVRHNAFTPVPPVKKYIVTEPIKDVSVERSNGTETPSVFSSDGTTHPSDPNDTVDTEKSVIQKQSVVESPRSREKSATVVPDPNAPSADETRNDNETHALSVQEQIDALKSQGLIPEGATVEIIAPGERPSIDPEELHQRLMAGADMRQVSLREALSMVDKLETKDDPKWQKAARTIRAMLNHRHEHAPEDAIFMLNRDILPDDF